LQQRIGHPVPGVPGAWHLRGTPEGHLRERLRRDSDPRGGLRGAAPSTPCDTRAIEPEALGGLVVEEVVHDMAGT